MFFAEPLIRPILLARFNLILIKITKIRTNSNSNKTHEQDSMWDFAGGEAVKKDIDDDGNYNNDKNDNDDDTNEHDSRHVKD